MLKDLTSTVGFNAYVENHPLNKKRQFLNTKKIFDIKFKGYQYNILLTKENNKNFLLIKPGIRKYDIDDGILAIFIKKNWIIYESYSLKNNIGYLVLINIDNCFNNDWVIIDELPYSIDDRNCFDIYIDFIEEHIKISNVTTFFEDFFD